MSRPPGLPQWLLRLAYRPPSARARRDAEILTHLRACHAYGAPRLIDDLRDLGLHVGQKRVARVMRLGGLVGVHL